MTIAIANLCFSRHAIGYADIVCGQLICAAFSSDSGHVNIPLFTMPLQNALKSRKIKIEVFYDVYRKLTSHLGNVLEPNVIVIFFQIVEKWLQT